MAKSRFIGEIVSYDSLFQICNLIRVNSDQKFKFVLSSEPIKWQFEVHGCLVFVKIMVCMITHRAELAKQFLLKTKYKTLYDKTTYGLTYREYSKRIEVTTGLLFKDNFPPFGTIYEADDILNFTNILVEQLDAMFATIKQKLPEDDVEYIFSKCQRYAQLR